MGGFVYILRCADQSYYTGSTSKPLDERVAEHQAGAYDTYTASRLPVTLVYSEEFGDIRDAHAAEQQIKGWSRVKKESLISGRWDLVSFHAKRPTARVTRHGSRLASRAPHHDTSVTHGRHPEVRAQRASKDDGK
jgi:putative endonuclease